MRHFIFMAFLACPVLTFTACQAAGDDSFLSHTRKVLEQSGAGSILSSQSIQNTSLASLSNSEIIAGLKQALEIGSTKVVSNLGRTDGFYRDPKIHIPLPGQLQRVDKALETIGMSSLTDDLELRLNRAAELATPRAKELFINSITQMTISDAKTILTGPDNAATQYLRKTMGAELADDMKPIVANALAQAGAIKAYDNTMGQYQNIPFMPDVKADLNDFVVNKALDGIFYYVAAEEKAIRENPAQRTTDLLKKVFGAVKK